MASGEDGDEPIPGRTEENVEIARRVGRGIGPVAGGKRAARGPAPRRDVASARHSRRTRALARERPDFSQSEEVDPVLAADPEARADLGRPGGQARMAERARKR